MRVESDLDKGTTLGDPDGPDQFVPELGLTVPTFVDPREDLIGDHARGKFKRLSHHVPFKLRGDFKFEDWPIEFRAKIAKPRIDIEGFVICGGLNREGNLCRKKAQNRSVFCTNHGGGLHPADKKLSAMTIAPLDENRVARLDRVQKFMQGLIKPDELDDDEIQGQFVRNDQGVKISTGRLGIKFQQQIAKELHRRLNDFLRCHTADMLRVMVDVARNDMYEAADRIKAAVWISERTMGKTPEVLVHAQADLPYTSILESIEGGSREDYRRGSGGASGVDVPAYEVIDAQVEEDDGETSVVETEIGESAKRTEFVEGEAEDVEGSVLATAAERKAKLKAMRKEKSRRYAARAAGATSLTAMPWLVEFTPVYQVDNDQEVLVRHRMRFFPPERQTKAVVDRLTKSAH